MYKHVSPVASEQEKRKAYSKKVVLTVEGTAWIAAAEIERGKTILKSLGALDGLTQRELEAVLLTYHKQGAPYIERYLERKLKGDERPLGIGEGKTVFYYEKKLTAILKPDWNPAKLFIQQNPITTKDLFTIYKTRP